MVLFQWETTFLSYITTFQRQQTNQIAITGRVSIAVHCRALGQLSSHNPEGDVILNVYVSPCQTSLSVWSTCITHRTFCVFVFAVVVQVIQLITITIQLKCKNLVSQRFHLLLTSTKIRNEKFPQIKAINKDKIKTKQTPTITKYACGWNFASTSTVTLAV